MASFTVLGANGFIGRHLVRHLRAQGHAVFTPGRGDGEIYRQSLGHVFHAIGVTADFRTRPFDTMEAHVAVAGELLRRAHFDSFTYLSSTRLYGNLGSTAEDTDFTVNPANGSDLYNLSKLAGEALCLAHPQPSVRIARLSNVYGEDMDRDGTPSQNFLAAVIRDAVCRGRIRLHTALESAKDYIAVEDVVRALVRIALDGTERIYNVGAGRNVSHAELADALARLTGCTVDVVPGAPETAFPALDVTRLARLFAACAGTWSPAALLDRLPGLVSGCSHEPAHAAGGSA